MSSWRQLVHRSRYGSVRAPYPTSLLRCARWSAVAPAGARYLLRGGYVSEEKAMIADGVRLGVELFTSDAPDLPPRRGDRGRVDDDDDDYAPASGKYRAFGRGWQRTVVEFGQDTVEAAARVMGEQVSTVLRSRLPTSAGRCRWMRLGACVSPVDVVFPWFGCDRCLD
jgi:hypothetical protein